MEKVYGKFGILLLVLLMMAGVCVTGVLAADSVPDNSSERKLEIYKTDTNKTPLANIQFSIYKVPEGQTTSAIPTTDEVAAIEKTGNPVATITTDKDGHASYGFGQGSGSDGVYLVVENFSVAVKTQVSPFYVSMPLTNPTGDGWVYDVVVYPKNDTTDGPTVDKDVASVGNKSASYDIGAIQTWIISGRVMDDLWHTDATEEDVYADNYSFTDKIDSRLTYEDNLKVKLLEQDGSEITLGSGDYVMTGTTATRGNAGGTLMVTLTEAGMKDIMQTLGDVQTEVDKGSKKKITEPKIRVYYDTAINTTAMPGETISNGVTLSYTNSKTESATVANPPEVHMGGLAIDKYKKGDANTKLPGATFKLAREAASSTTKDDTIWTGLKSIDINWVKAYDSLSLTTATLMDSVTTGTDGAAYFNGLAYGTYYLVETQAPKGYNLISAPIQVTIDANSAKTANAIKVENSNQFTLPLTGAAGTLLFTVIGVVLIGAAGALIVVYRRKKKNADH